MRAEEVVSKSSEATNGNQLSTHTLGSYKPCRVQGYCLAGTHPRVCERGETVGPEDHDIQDWSASRGAQVIENDRDPS